jgi:ubiquinone/menaquinone biosynthesis C-methylase UbiE
VIPHRGTCYVAGMAPDEFLPALRFGALTRFYDPVVGLTTREPEFKRRLLTQLAPAGRMRILDLGCGTGTLALLIAEMEPEAELHGLDADPEMLARARRKAEAAGGSAPGIEFREGLADELPWQDGYFDAVVSTLFFHHLKTEVKDRAVAEIARVLRPGGSLHVADWGRPSDPAMAVLSLGIRLLDGFEPTADNFAGRLPEILERGGLTDARETDRLRTVFGTLALYSASRR